MTIDRNNYEEFFILYLDNELSVSDRQLVEEFAAANPDLKAELHLLMQSKLTPDMEITFSGKNALLKTETGISADTTSMLLYIDQELPAAEKASFEQWLAQNPAAQKELGLLQQTKLQPESIIFPYKESLYRREERRVIPIRWWRMAAAAVLLLGVSSAAFMFSQKRQSNSGIAAQNAGETTSIAQTNGTAAKDTPASQTEKLQSTEQAAPVDGNGIDQNNAEYTNTKAENTGRSTNSIAENTTAKFHGNNDAGISSGTQPVNDATQPVKGTQEEDNFVVAKRTEMTQLVDNNLYENDEFKADPSLTVHKQINPLPAVTQEDDQSLDIMSEPGKKNRLRGFFRKITRTIEKTTNIKATDGDDRLLVGGLAIKF